MNKKIIIIGSPGSGKSFLSKKLSELTGIPLRTIQQYEQRQKNINKASVEYMIKLSQTLSCEVECLIEKVVN